ncbi:MAG: carboxypeptidase-like regulatory domain-containing protein [Gemmatimonadaceae bacterium]
MSRIKPLGFAVVMATSMLPIGLAYMVAQPFGGPSDTSAADGDISGVVTGARGPEAGVWVIAETTDLPTKFAKIVVTDDRGRYLIPELPKAKYSVWVRGYGGRLAKAGRRPRRHCQPAFSYSA